MENFQTTLQLDTTVDQLFDALTTKIPLWWTELFEGSANGKGDIFTVRFGDNIYKTMKVEECSENSRIVWKVTNSLIGIQQLKNQTEWIGTTIIWEILPNDRTTILKLIHLGLTSETECYDICANGWQQFTDSLRLFLETGVGKPFKNS